MTRPKSYEKVCTRCQASYVGIKVSKFCDLCLAERAREKCRKPGNPVEDVEKVCNACQAVYMGPQRSKFCLRCYSERFREANRIRKAHEWQTTKAIKATKVRPGLPPPCQRCHYCHETDQYPSGMACLVESFMRCSPWSLGAKPLKERENV
jgi:hypothetical protein